MYVCKEKCDQCLFTDKRIVSLKRMKEILKSCERNNTFFQCHKSSHVGLKEQVCCSGYWENFKNQFNLGRIAQRLNIVRFVKIVDGKIYEQKKT